MRMVGIRGATTVYKNEKDEILMGTQELLERLIKENNILEENVVSMIFTTTPDLNAEFPAKACRLMGWTSVPMIGAVEADVPHGIEKCIRILIHAYLPEGHQVKHIYLNEAVKLRPDIVKPDIS